MKSTHSESTQKQREYYAATADQYDDLHCGQDSCLDFGLHVMLGLMEHLDIASVLDVGSGTGRTLLAIQKKLPQVEAYGVEPVDELREVAHGKGIPKERLLYGDATQLAQADDSVDLVCSFGVLHHIEHASKAVDEMLRIARKAVFIADANNFGQGSPRKRLVKQILHKAGLWPLATKIQTRGKGHFYSKGDGIYYSYSVFNDFDRIRHSCSSTHLITLSDTGKNPYQTAKTVAVLGIKGSGTSC